MSEIFKKKQFIKSILKHVTSKFVVQKLQIYDQFELFLRTKYINSFKIIRGKFRFKLCPKLFSLRPLNVKNTGNLFEIFQNLPYLTLLYWSQNFETKTIVD